MDKEAKFPTKVIYEEMERIKAEKSKSELFLKMENNVGKVKSIEEGILFK